VRTIAGLRRNTAARTDERVRLTGEVIQVGPQQPVTRSLLCYQHLCEMVTALTCEYHPSTPGSYAAGNDYMIS
jgi:hypothetical protein